MGPHKKRRPSKYSHHLCQVVNLFFGMQLEGIHLMLQVLAWWLPISQVCERSISFYNFRNFFWRDHAELDIDRLEELVWRAAKEEFVVVGG